VYVMKLNAADLSISYAALLGGPCRNLPSSLTVDSRGRALMAMGATFGLPLRNPLIGASLVFTGPTDPAQGGAAVLLDKTGSTLLWSSYLDSYPPLQVALAPDGSLYAAQLASNGALTIGSSPAGFDVSLLVLHPDMEPAVSIDSVFNAFSGFSDGVVGGSLITLTGGSFSAESIDLGLAPAQSLPTQLGGVQVFFDGVASQILRVTQNQVTCIAPYGVSDRTAIQVVTEAGSSNAVVMPVLDTAPGLLSRNFPDVAPYFAVADAMAKNADGTVNDADHPAARGSMLTLYGTGFGSYKVYVWGELQDPAVQHTFGGEPPAGTSNVAGMIPAVFAIQAPVPNVAQPSGNVDRVTVAILPVQPGVFAGAGHPPFNAPSPTDYVAVYVR
jgi:uncharacterized protein (TIGR03437 family)